MHNASFSYSYKLHAFSSNPIPKHDTSEYLPFPLHLQIIYILHCMMHYVCSPIQTL